MPGDGTYWYVKSVEVVGLSGRKDTYRQDLNPDVNIFFGVNGSGKTTLLRIIHAALNMDTPSLMGAPFESARVEILFPEGNTVITRSITMPDEAAFEDILRHIPPSVRRSPSRLARYTAEFTEDFGWQADGSPPRILRASQKTSLRNRLHMLHHRYLPTNRLMENSPSVSALDDPSEQSLDEYFAQSIQRLWSNYSAEVLGDVGAAQESGLARILEGVIAPERSQRALGEDFDPDKAFDRVKSFLRRRRTAYLMEDKREFIRRFENDPGFKRVVLDINEVEEQIERALEPRKRLEELVSRLISGPKQISFQNSQIRTITASNREISLERLSSGEKQLLRILIEALAAGGRPIIIDEPELSMHIDWQQVLIESIQTIDESAQVITATHSPEIMANIEDGKIFRL